MSEFGPNTDATGGTRYSEGKPLMTWLPWRGIPDVWAYADDVLGGSLDYMAPERVLRTAFFQLAEGMNLASERRSWREALAGSLYWLLQLCQVHEMTQDGERPAEFEPVRIPAMGLWEVCRVSEYGAGKYSEFDWNQGQAFSTLLSSAMRHVCKALAFGPFSVDSNHGDEPEGTEYSGLLHAAHAAWNVACLLDFLAQGRAEELDDVSVWHGLTAADRRQVEALAEEEGIPEHRAVQGFGVPEAVIAAWEYRRMQHPDAEVTVVENLPDITVVQEETHTAGEAL